MLLPVIRVDSLVYNAFQVLETIIWNGAEKNIIQRYWKAHKLNCLYGILSCNYYLGSDVPNRWLCVVLFTYGLNLGSSKVYLDRLTFSISNIQFEYVFWYCMRLWIYIFNLVLLVSHGMNLIFNLLTPSFSTVFQSRLIIEESFFNVLRQVTRCLHIFHFQSSGDHFKPLLAWQSTRVLGTLIASLHNRSA